MTSINLDGARRAGEQSVTREDTALPVGLDHRERPGPRPDAGAQGEHCKMAIHHGPGWYHVKTRDDTYGDTHRADPLDAAAETTSGTAYPSISGLLKVRA